MSWEQEHQMSLATSPHPHPTNQTRYKNCVHTMILEEDDVATCIAGQEEARLDPSSLESQ